MQYKLEVKMPGQGKVTVQINGTSDFIERTQVSLEIEDDDTATSHRSGGTDGNPGKDRDFIVDLPNIG